MHIQLVVPACSDAPLLRGYRASSHTLHSGSIRLHPFTYSGKTLKRLRRYGAIRTRPYVEQQIRITAGGTDKILYQLIRTLIFIVTYAIAPGIIHGLTRLKRKSAHILPRQTGFILARLVTLKNLYVLPGERSHMVIVTHEAGWLQRMNQCILVV